MKEARDPGPAAELPAGCDVLVIGGGPAGSSAATMLAGQGYDVVLVDRQSHPRFNVGESLLPHVWKFTDTLGVSERIAAEGFVEKRGGIAAWGGKIRQFSFSDFGYTRPGLHAERDRFDYLLLDHARNRGVRVFEGVHALAPADPDACDGRIDYRVVDSGDTGTLTARYVIDASGQAALLSRQMRTRVMDEDFRFIALWAYFKGGRYVGVDGRAHDMAEIRHVAPVTYVAAYGEWGWGWYIPMRERTSVGLVVPVEAFRSSRGATRSAEDWFLAHYVEVPAFRQLLENATCIDGSFHTIRDYAYLPRKLTGPRYYIVGDAAAFVDPIFSLGVVIAMYSGMLAAWAIDRSLRRSALADNSAAVFRDQFTGFYELARSMAMPGRPIPAGSRTLAARFAAFQRKQEQELIHVAALLTSRSENFDGVVTRQRGAESVQRYFRELDAIGF